MTPWTTEKLEKLCNIQTGGTPSRQNPEYFYGDIPWVTTVALGKAHINQGHATEFLTLKAVSESASKVIPAGSLLVGIRVGVGKTSITDCDMATNQDIAALTHIDSRCDVEYLQRVLRSYSGYFNSIKRGATIQGITTKVLRQLEIPLPPIDTQRKIAVVLDKAQELIDLRKAQIEKLDEFLRSVFLDMFGDPVTNPKGWVIKRLCELCDVRDGTHDSPSYVENGYPLITSKNINGDKIDFSTANLISEKDFMLIQQRSKVDFGDILMPMIGTIGHPVIVNTRVLFAIKNVALIKFANNSIVNNTYIRDLFRSHYFIHLIKDKNRGGTQKFIALGDIRSFFIPVPAQLLQCQYSSIVEKTEQQKALMQQSLTEMENNFSSLMQRAFRGERF